MVIISRILTIIDKREWPGELKCLWISWFPPLSIWNICPDIFLSNGPLVSPTLIKPQRLHSTYKDLQVKFPRLLVHKLLPMKIQVNECLVIHVQVYNFYKTFWNRAQKIKSLLNSSCLIFRNKIKVLWSLRDSLSPPYLSSESLAICYKLVR